MNPKYTHDFSSASIKHIIEAEFYQFVGQSLNSKKFTGTIVTGPDCERHLLNYRKYISKYNVRICETNPLIYAQIHKFMSLKVSVCNDSIENYGSIFTDCDLTCTSDISVIKNTLIKQLTEQSSNCTSNKAFIFSFGLRSKEHKSIQNYIQPIIGLLGAQITTINISESSYTMKQRECKWMKLIKLDGPVGRIVGYKCYSYNAGGGPMLTCLIIYR